MEPSFSFHVDTRLILVESHKSPTKSCLMLALEGFPLHCGNHSFTRRSLGLEKKINSAFLVLVIGGGADCHLSLSTNSECENEPTQGILDITAGGIFLYKTPNQAFQFLDDKVLFKHDWPIKSKNEHHRKSISFADGCDSKTDNSRYMENLKAMDSQIISLNEELQDIRNKYNELREENASKNDDTPMCERHEVNYIQYEEYQNRNSHDSYSHQSHYDPNDSEKLLTELNNDLEDFKRYIRSMRTVHDKLFTRDDGKTTGVLPNKKSKIVNQEPQSKTDLEKSMTKFLDDQRVTNMFFKNNVNDMILKMKQNEKNFQIKIKKMERKMDEWSKSQNISLEQTDWTEPQPPPQAQTEQVNVVFTGSGKSNDSPKTQKDPPPPIIVNNKIGKDKPIKTSKKGYHVMCTYGLCRLFRSIGIGIKLYEWADNLVAPELVIDHHLLDRSAHAATGMFMCLVSRDLYQLHAKPFIPEHARERNHLRGDWGFPLRKG
ncbi:hypothetical protein Tco_0387225 [Tanacetum coccineum]